MTQTPEQEETLYVVTVRMFVRASDELDALNKTGQMMRAQGATVVGYERQGIQLFSERRKEKRTCH